MKDEETPFTECVLATAVLVKLLSAQAAIRVMKFALPRPLHSLHMLERA